MGIKSTGGKTEAGEANSMDEVSRSGRQSKVWCWGCDTCQAFASKLLHQDTRVSSWKSQCPHAPIFPHSEDGF